MNNVTEQIEYRIAVILWTWFPPILLVIGTFGNIFTIIILMQRKNRHSSTAMYLTALAASDLLALWAGLFTLWIEYIYEIELGAISMIWCKSQYFLIYTAFQCSSWFLVAVTAERFIGVWFPHKVKFFCNTKNSCVIIVMIIVFFMILNTHWFYGYSTFSHSTNNETGVLHCDYIDDDNYAIFIEIWDWIDLFLVSLMPLTLLLIVNSSIIFFIFKRKKTTLNRIAPLNVTTSASGRKVSQMTITLIIVSIVFAVCSTPVLLYIITPLFAEQQANNYVAEEDELWWAVVNCLSYLNTTLNFVLYFLSGSKFRRLVKDFFRCNRSTTTSVTN